MDAQILHQALWGVVGLIALLIIGMALAKLVFVSPIAAPHALDVGADDSSTADSEDDEPQHSNPCEDCEALLVMKDSIIDEEVAPDVAKWLEAREWHRQFQPELHAAVWAQVNAALNSQAEGDAYCHSHRDI